jgi:signal transduction histidine kinase
MAWVWVLLLLLAIVPPLWLWVLRPLRRMVEVAARLGSGDLATPVPQTHRDEFGALERAFEQLRVALAQSMATRERLLLDVSHEIRGPLARMMLALPLLERDPPNGPIKAVLEGEVRAIDRLTEEVLAVARAGYQEVLQPAPVDLPDMLTELGTERQLATADKHVALVLELAPVTALGDARLLHRAAANVLDNAIKFTRPGGTIRVACREERGEAVLQVADSGPGIAAEHLPRIFEPFYRPDDSRSRETGGTGLGLSIVREIASRHGGTVAIDCPPDGGTVVTLRVPLAPRSG